MSAKRLFLTIILGLFLVASATAQSYTYNYEEMKMDEYNLKLQEWQEKENAAKTEIDSESTKIEELNKTLADLKSQEENAWNDIYALVGTDEAGFKSFMDQLNALSNDVSGLLASSPDDIFRRMNELKDYQNQVVELKKDKKSILTDAMNKIASIEGMLNQAIEKAKSANATYIVKRGDFLWGIAKNPDVYGNAFAWIRLWTANTSIINNPDLIFPEQILNVHRVSGPNEYVVQSGEFLYKIAKESLGDPFKWQQLYQANKSVIGEDPTRIYPHMILKMP